MAVVKELNKYLPKELTNIIVDFNMPSREELKEKKDEIIRMLPEFFLYFVRTRNFLLRCDECPHKGQQVTTYKEYVYQSWKKYTYTFNCECINKNPLLINKKGYEYIVYYPPHKTLCEKSFHEFTMRNYDRDYAEYQTSLK